MKQPLEARAASFSVCRKEVRTNSGEYNQAPRRWKKERGSASAYTIGFTLITNLHAKQLAVADYKLIGAAAPLFSLFLFFCARTFPIGDRANWKVPARACCGCVNTKERRFWPPEVGMKWNPFVPKARKWNFAISSAPARFRSAAPTLCLVNKQILAKSLRTHARKILGEHILVI